MSHGRKVKKEMTQATSPRQAFSKMCTQKYALFLTLFLANIFSSAHAIIIHPAISDSLYRVNVTTAPFFVVLNAPGDCAGSIIAGSDPKYVHIYLSLNALWILVDCDNTVSVMQMPMHLLGNAHAHTQTCAQKWRFLYIATAAHCLCNETTWRNGSMPIIFSDGCKVMRRYE